MGLGTPWPLEVASSSSFLSSTQGLGIISHPACPCLHHLGLLILTQLQPGASLPKYVWRQTQPSASPCLYSFFIRAPTSWSLILVLSALTSLPSEDKLFPGDCTSHSPSLRLLEPSPAGTCLSSPYSGQVEGLHPQMHQSLIHSGSWTNCSFCLQTPSPYSQLVIQPISV